MLLLRHSRNAWSSMHPFLRPVRPVFRVTLVMHAVACIPSGNFQTIRSLFHEFSVTLVMHALACIPSLRQSLFRRHLIPQQCAWLRPTRHFSSAGHGP
jgi:hypothetical protein